jgi:hypothetical protein
MDCFIGYFLAEKQTFPDAVSDGLASGQMCWGFTPHTTCPAYAGKAGLWGIGYETLSFEDSFVGRKSAKGLLSGTFSLCFI